MAARARRGDVSLAQVEQELRAAEAYLHQYGASSAPGASGGDSNGRAAADGTIAQIHAPMDRRPKERDPRQAVLGETSRNASAQNSGSPVLDADAASPEASPALSRSSCKASEERSQLLQKLFQACEERSTRRDETTASIEVAAGYAAPVSPFGSPRSDASDIIGNGLTAHAESSALTSTCWGKGNVKWSDLEKPREQSVVQRLHLDGTSRHEQQERAKEELEELKLRECTFKPKVNNASRSMLSIGGYKPIHQRLSEIQRAKAESIKRIQEKIELEEEGAAPFIPTINPISREIAAKIHMERALEDQQDCSDSDVDDPDESTQNDGERITFKPDIGNADEVLRELRPDRFSESKSQKLYRMIYNDPKKTELKKQQMRDEQYSKYTFKPAINPISKALGRQSTLDELAQPVTNLGPGHLHTHHVSSSSPQQQRRSSAKSPPEASRAALQQYFAGKRFRSRVALEMDEAEKAECTSQPALITKPRVRGNHSSTSKLCTKQRQGKSIWRSDNTLHLIETGRSKKTEALEAKRNELELQELRECTFQPNICKHRDSQQRSSKSDASRHASAPPSSRDAPVIVRGLGWFLEMKEQAKRLRAEQKQREEKAFRPNAAYEPRSYTVPKPFNLSGSSKDAIRRRLKVREEMRAKEKQECTFAPVPIESKHRKVLQNLLRD